MLAIYSCNGFAREIAVPAEQSLRASKAISDSAADIVFVEDDTRDIGTRINGWPVISFDDLIGAEHRHRSVSVAIAAPRIRSAVVAKCEAAGLKFGSVSAPEHIRYAGIEIGDGAICCAYSMITANARIGRHFHLNIYSYVAHDCVIGDFVTFAPGVRCNGRVHIEDFAYIGTNAVFKQGQDGAPLRVGAGATVGMGAVVTKDVPAGVTVVGNPARPIERKQTKFEL
jgi:sugar O-acyltransferase (sialic acid O-acetyltransferase NeuD family)